MACLRSHVLTHAMLPGCHRPHACGFRQRRMAALEKLLAKARGRDFVALVRGPSLVQGLKIKAEDLLLDAALVGVKKLLADVPRMRVWNDKSKPAAHLPAFSASPQPYVTQIAEQLFLLPDLLDNSSNNDDSAQTKQQEEAPATAGEEGGDDGAFMEEVMSQDEVPWRDLDRSLQGLRRAYKGWRRVVSSFPPLGSREKV